MIGPGGSGVSSPELLFDDQDCRSDHTAMARSTLQLHMVALTHPHLGVLTAADKRHDFHELVYLEHGDYRPGGGLKALTAGSYVVYPAGVEHTPRVDRSLATRLWLLQWTGWSPGWREPFIGDDADRRLLLALSWMRDRQDDWHATDDSDIRRQLHGLLRVVLREVDGRHRQTVATASDPVEQAHAMLINGLQLRWSLSELAKHVGRSPARLCRIFAERYGEPPMAYLTRRRVEAAVAQIVSGNDHVESIAPELGYASGDALARAVRRVTGKTVRQLRRS